MQGNRTCQCCNNQQSQNAIQNRLSREILITDYACDYQSSNYEPLKQIEARVFGFSLNIHLLVSCKKTRQILGKMAGQEGIEPPTYGFGDRRSAN
ncbi:hypothetical protein PSEUDO8BK_90057 [Pseudomonas sp. 8BK]|nr:hypothetical protein PSEUDO8BK_90057 [Pseudomonas sp. 8BK]